jgi:hypothetical protein
VPDARAVAVGLAVGLVHAAVLLAVAVRLGYPVGPAAYSPVGLLWRYGGLVVVAAVPAWLAVRFRLLTPAAAVAGVTGYVLALELAPPGPTFRDVAELEGLAGPTGVTVVEDGLYVVRYTVGAPVWTVGALFLGFVEYVVRNSWQALPSVPDPVPWLATPASRRRAVAVAAAGGLAHAAVTVWFAVRLGVTLTGGFGWLLYVAGAVGMWALAAGPLYLLVRHRLVVPATLLALSVLVDVQTEVAGDAEGLHALYFGGWFLSLGVLLAVAGVEYGIRHTGAHRWLASRV